MTDFSEQSTEAPESYLSENYLSENYIGANHVDEKSDAKLVSKSAYESCVLAESTKLHVLIVQT